MSGGTWPPCPPPALLAAGSPGGITFGSIVTSLITVAIACSLPDLDRGLEVEVDELAGLEDARVLDAVRRGDGLPVAAAIAARSSRLCRRHRLQVRALRRRGLRLGARGRLVAPLDARGLGGVVEGEGGDLLLRNGHRHRGAQRAALEREELQRLLHRLDDAVELERA